MIFKTITFFCLIFFYFYLIISIYHFLLHFSLLYFFLSYVFKVKLYYQYLITDYQLFVYKENSVSAAIYIIKSGDLTIFSKKTVTGRGVFQLL